MRYLRLTWLAPASLLVTVALITLGVIVRVTGAGEGCPDWPLCYGSVLPPASPLAWIEFAHRLGAALVALLVAALPVSAAIEEHRDTTSWVLSLLAPGILITQILLGGLTVLSKLTPAVVAVHLGVSLLLAAVLTLLTVRTHRQGMLPRERIGRRAGLTAVIVCAVGGTFTLLTLGAVVVGSGASLACMDWPLCAAALVPIGQGSQRLLQGLHRLAAGGVILMLGWLVTQVHPLRRAWPAGWRLAWLALIVALAQALLGGVLVLAQLPTWLRAAHLLLATVVWVGTIAIAAGWWWRPRLASAAAAGA